MPQETLVEARGLTKTFRRADGTEVLAVQGIDLDIHKGEVFSMLGPNGAGKTTTISMISGLLAPTSGDAKIGGYSITKQPMEAKKLLGVVPQEIALYPMLTARQNLEFFGKMYGLGGKELAASVDEVLDFTDLRDRAKDRVETFSGGMKRRVNIGVGLLHKPRLVYMDEPTVGVDPQSRRRILDTVIRLREERNMTVLYTTHLMEEAQELSNRVGIVDMGKVIALGTVGELIQQVGEEDRLVLNIGHQELHNGLLERLQGIEGVTRALYDAPTQLSETNDAIQNGKITIYAKRGRKALPQVIQLTNEAGLEIVSVEVREPDLEAVFLQLTGRALRD
ncbi:MAG: ABC transporter ATP-binding protein [Anaerolineae bacterium]|nr:ABC transporter ATP-binding protein [Anaerolineae bacterium]MBN8621136.1 ABC transporter ATP-binding protein [Anaerolineae bacterium]